MQRAYRSLAHAVLTEDFSTLERMISSTALRIDEDLNLQDFAYSGETILSTLMQQMNSLKPTDSRLPQYSKVIRMLIAIGAKARYFTCNPSWSVLHVAAARNWDKVAKVVVLKDVKLAAELMESRDSNGCTPLEVAIEHRRDEMIKLLILAGSNVDLDNDRLVDYFCSRQFDFAGSNGIKLLKRLANGIRDPRRKSRMSGYLLLRAIMWKDKVLTDWLMGQSPDVTFQLGDMRYTMLHCAVDVGWLNLVEDLILAGSDINAQTARQATDPAFTPLHFAAVKHQTQMTELLIKTGADLEVMDVHGNTPRMLALKNKAKMVEDSLILAGAL